MVTETQAWLLERAKEQSTWLGLVSLLGSLGIVLDPQLTPYIVALGTALGGIVGILTKENEK